MVSRRPTCNLGQARRLRLRGPVWGIPDLHLATDARKLVIGPGFTPSGPMKPSMFRP